MKIVFIAGSNRGKESASEKLASLLMSPADQSLRFEILEMDVRRIVKVKVTVGMNTSKENKD